MTIQKHVDKSNRHFMLFHRPRFIIPTLYNTYSHQKHLHQIPIHKIPFPQPIPHPKPTLNQSINQSHSSSPMLWIIDGCTHQNRVFKSIGNSHRASTQPVCIHFHRGNFLPRSVEQPRSPTWQVAWRTAESVRRDGCWEQKETALLRSIVAGLRTGERIACLRRDSGWPSVSRSWSKGGQAADPKPEQ